MKLSPEGEMLIIGARIEIDPTLRDRFIELIKQGLDWGKVLYLATNHKMLTLVWYHIKSFDLVRYLDPQISRLMATVYNAHAERNRLYLEEFGRVLEAADALKVRIVPLKGALLLGTIYTDLGMRTINDIDILVERDAIETLMDAFDRLGYSQKTYDSIKGDLRPVSRRKKLFWTLYVSNLMPFRKKAESALVGSYSFDVHVTITWKGKEQYEIDMAELFEKTHEVGFLGTRYFPLSCEDNIIHLCGHLYRHAVLLDTIRDVDDLALIKFCDLREFILASTKHLSWNRLTERVESYRIQKPVYYTFHYLDMLYRDTVPRDFLENIRPEDTSYLDQYGMLDSENAARWRLSFMERMFNFKRLTIERAFNQELFRSHKMD